MIFLNTEFFFKIIALDEEILSIDRLSEDEKKKASLRKGSTNGAIDIVIFADEDDAVELKITYSAFALLSYL